MLPTHEFLQERWGAETALPLKNAKPDVTSQEAITGRRGKGPPYLPCTGNSVQLALAIVLSRPRTQETRCGKEWKGEETCV